MPRQKQNAQMVFISDLKSVDRDISLAGPGIFGDDNAGSDILAVVFFMMNGNGQLIKVYVAGDAFLDGCLSRFNNHRGNGAGLSRRKVIAHCLNSYAHGLGKHFAITGQRRYYRYRISLRQVLTNRTIKAKRILAAGFFADRSQFELQLDFFFHVFQQSTFIQDLHPLTH